MHVFLCPILKKNEERPRVQECKKESLLRNSGLIKVANKSHSLYGSGHEWRKVPDIFSSSHRKACECRKIGPTTEGGCFCSCLVSPRYPT